MNTMWDNAEIGLKLERPFLKFIISDTLKAGIRKIKVIGMGIDFCDRYGRHRTGVKNHVNF